MTITTGQGYKTQNKYLKDELYVTFFIKMKNFTNWFI